MPTRNCSRLTVRKRLTALALLNAISSTPSPQRHLLTAISSVTLVRVISRIRCSYASDRGSAPRKSAVREPLGLAPRPDGAKMAP